MLRTPFTAFHAAELHVRPSLSAARRGPPSLRSHPVVDDLQCGAAIRTLPLRITPWVLLRRRQMKKTCTQGSRKVNGPWAERGRNLPYTPADEAKRPAAVH